MTRQEQIDLLNEFVGRVRDSMIAKADNWPEDWDGFELRWLAQEAFTQQAATNNTADRRKRYKKFENDILVKALV